MRRVDGAGAVAVVAITQRDSLCEECPTQSESGGVIKRVLCAVKQDDG